MSKGFGFRFGGFTTAALIIGASLSLIAAPANAIVPSLSDQQVAAIRIQMTDGGIPTTTQDSLILKIQAGAIPDSYRGVAPVSTITQDLGSTIRTTEIFADGSRSWTVFEKPVVSNSGTVSTLAGITGCYTSLGWRVNCKVSIVDLFSSASFVIDWKPSTTNKAQMRDMRAKTCVNTLGSCSVSGSIKRAIQSSAGPAYAELSYTATVTIGGATVNGAFGLRASGSVATTY